MKRSKVLVLSVVLAASASFAQGGKAAPPGSPPQSPQGKTSATPAGPMDLSKMGPWTRKPTNEKAAKKDIEAFFKMEEELSAKGDMEGMLSRVDFPVFMVTDDAEGNIEAKTYSREEYLATMRPFFENMPKDAKYAFKPSIVVLSDSLASVVNEFSMTTGKQKMSGRGASLLVRVGGQWKWKTMAEAGWGGMPAPTAKK